MHHHVYIVFSSSPWNTRRHVYYATTDKFTAYWGRKEELHNFTDDETIERWVRQVFGREVSDTWEFEYICTNYHPVPEIVLRALAKASLEPSGGPSAQQ